MFEQKNHTIRKLDVSWNGFGFEGSLAIGESLKMNRTLKVLDMANNRINWDCVPYIGRGIRANRCLEVLDVSRLLWHKITSEENKIRCSILVFLCRCKTTR